MKKYSMDKIKVYEKDSKNSVTLYMVACGIFDVKGMILEIIKEGQETKIYYTKKGHKMAQEMFFQNEDMMRWNKWDKYKKEA